ncbi:DUF2339 domain-containing protein [Pseudoalteromonas sp. MMG024]|uniref:DUF2339 domain-containing protein n=1 Tax=Pseudoalteromonas sp. MMG024 TaxID=2909980 RepID=UPI001F3A50D3|nr:DUF2339 domain-containing protein [Pseudoalteromonas sp. MMG024]MCF6455603.1 DUF2339 domain-containing protein [Pseudoalteromonas sp. MMG024]
METLLGLFALVFAVFMLGGLIVAWYSFLKLRSADAKIKELTIAVLHLKSLVKKLSETNTLHATSVKSSQESVVEQSAESSTQAADDSQPQTPHVDSISNVSVALATHQEQAETSLNEKPRPKPKALETVSLAQRLEQFLANNGLLWIGAGILALGGIFLAKYSIESGLISITLRLILGGVFALALVILAEYLYRKHGASNHVTNTSAALASGGIITGFALVLATFSYYHFISPVVAFAALAAISLIATALALRFGPLLAVIGIIGAYTVPALVNTGSNNVFALLMYVNFVSIAAIWVANKVKREWLWWQSFVGHFVWLTISVAIAHKSDIWVIAATMAIAFYLYVLSSVLGWRLTNKNLTPLAIKVLLMPRKEQLALVLNILLLVLFYSLHGFSSSLLIVSVLLSALCMYLPLRHSAFDSWPFVSLIFSCFAIVSYPIVHQLDDPMLVFSSVFLYAQLVGVAYFVYSIVMQKLFIKRASFSLLLGIAPLLVFAVSYIVTPQTVETTLYPLWTVYLMVMAGYALWQITKAHHALATITFWLTANSFLALVFTMWLNASTLSLAICAQLVLIAYGQQRFKVELPLWLSKIALSLVLMRITLAPWTQQYSNELVFGVHWSLVVLPMMFAMVFYAYRLHSNSELKKWYEGALLHLIALFVTTETSYVLVGHYPDFSNLNFAELCVLSMNWLILAVVYWWRFKISSRSLYLYAGCALAAASGLCHLTLNTQYNPFLEAILIGDIFLFNWLLVMWAVPAVIIALVYYFDIVPKQFKLNKNKVLLPIASGFSFLFINGVVRSYFQTEQIRLSLPTSQAEIYSYSVVWLIIAAGFNLFGQRIAKSVVYQAGFAILLVVILKAFLFDMAHLDGLYRAISFIGLGLSLVALGWLFTRFKLVSEEAPK